MAVYKSSSLLAFSCHAGTHSHQGAIVAGSVIDERLTKRVGYQRWIAGLFEQAIEGEAKCFDGDVAHL
jgi:hypothetical protein